MWVSVLLLTLYSQAALCACPAVCVTAGAGMMDTTGLPPPVIQKVSLTYSSYLLVSWVHQIQWVYYYYLYLSNQEIGTSPKILQS